MDITLTASCIEFPGRAGELQRQNATAALLRELGDNYPHYHEVLVAKLEEAGGEPAVDSYRAGGDGSRDNIAGYVEHADTVQRIAISEQLLRRARAFRRHGRALDAPAHDEPPLWDSNYKLVDIEHPERSHFRHGLSLPFRPPTFGAAGPLV